MKRIFWVIFLFVFPFFVLTPYAEAHLAGQPAFFHINGKLAAQYIVFSSSIDNFVLPQDIGVDRYLVNTPINFQIKNEMLGIMPEILKDTVFLWKFGDGATAKGLTNTHIYKKPGSYVVTIEAQYKKDPPALIESSLLQVLPNSNYILPNARILVNGKESSDPLSDPLTIEYKDVNFDATKSMTGSSKIVSYQWDFGDTSQSSEVTVRHTYRNNAQIQFPRLRVVDENGFISDTFVQINRPLAGDANLASPSANSTTQMSSQGRQMNFVLLLVVVGFVVVGYYLHRK